MRGHRWALSLRVVGVMLVLAVSGAAAEAQRTESARRVPAEWEPQDAIWLQWPGRYEKDYETAFAEMASVIVRYERLHILHATGAIEAEARAAIAAAGGDPGHQHIVWHRVANDNAWMRDNGPVYVIDGDEMRVQNWRFDAWGGRFGPGVWHQRDDEVPAAVAAYLGLPLETVDIVHERGNLEFNGAGSVVLSWTTLGDHRRNPGYTRARAERDLARLFGVSQVVFIEGVLDGDLTHGHVDGIARFVDPSTVAVPICTPRAICSPNDHSVYEAAAHAVAEAGFDVERLPIEATVRYRGTTMNTSYMNWLVGNGFVIVPGFGHPQADAAARGRIERFFPGRDVHLVEMLGSWAAGGGVHCHTNDQPSLSLVGR